MNDLMKFDPASGWSKPYPSHAAQWREHNGKTAWLFNPWTGERRNAQDVGSDPFGLLINSGAALTAQHPARTEADVAEPCWCATCRPVSFGDMRMVLCPVCGNKRCPRASNHIYACTGSNDVRQVGSANMAHLAPQCLINGANMTRDEIEAIAQRPTYCKTDGEAVTLSRAERDALVAMARDGLRLSAVVDQLLSHSPDAECGTCGEAICPHHHPLHFHHDGCPACAEHEAMATEQA